MRKLPPQHRLRVGIGDPDRPPDWSLNLEDNPRAVVQIGADRLTVTARRATAEERQPLWVRITATYAGYTEYQERTAREIPVVILTPDAENRENA